MATPTWACAFAVLRAAAAINRVSTPVDFAHTALLPNNNHTSSKMLYKEQDIWQLNSA
jgi:hypothetical protein